MFSYQRVRPKSHSHTKYYLPKHMNTLYRVFSFKHQYTLYMQRRLSVSKFELQKDPIQITVQAKFAEVLVPILVILFFTKAHLHSLLSVRCFPLLIPSTPFMFLMIFFVRTRWHWSFNLFIPLLPPMWMHCCSLLIWKYADSWEWDFHNRCKLAALLQRFWFIFFVYY